MDDEFGVGLFIGTMTTLVVSISFFVFFEEKKPKAIDVYRGNTTLEITYRDSIPVDSTVVWKTNK